MTVAALARAAAKTGWTKAPAAVQDRVVDLVADCVAVAALGSQRGELRRLVEAEGRWAPAGEATVVGATRGWPSSTAAFLNACAVAADQLQDGHRLARGHPASHVVPAVLAVAEERDVGGVALLSSILAGYETGTRVGLAMGGTPPGVHDIGTWGQVAVAVAVSQLVAPGNSAAVQRALELAAAAVLLTDASTVFAGRTGSHAFLGASVQLGSALGLAAAAGLEPEPGALDRHFASVSSRSWRPELLASDLTPEADWGEYDVLSGYIKAHPTCAHLHGVNDAVQDLVDRGVTADDVSKVVVRTFSAAAAFDAVATNELGARFSIPTSVAVALITGRLDELTMVDETVLSPEVFRLARRVDVIHDSRLDGGYPEGRPARVEVFLRNGTTLSASSDRPRGDGDRAFDRTWLSRKAERLLRHRFGDAGVPVLQAVHDLPAGGGARDLGRALRSAAEAAA
jgi:2-methylcitrate dehydratase PrpD